jgi:hypothetical protein
MKGLSKEQYIGIVKFTLNSMIDLAKEDKNYNLMADILHYYETTVSVECILTQNEFLELCRDAGIR